MTSAVTGGVFFPVTSYRSVRAVRYTGTDGPFDIFDGMPAAEVTQRAYRATGIAPELPAAAP